MATLRYRPALYRLAILTAATALVPIIVGALVTTLNAGMAFRDWPTSDGQGMLSYPWLKSAGDKFIEHGHRLAGMLAGCMSILFACVVWRLESRRWVRWCGAVVVLTVIVQGLLGAGRVLADERRLALVHGAFGAAVFTFMASMALIQSRSWIDPPKVPAGAQMRALHVLAVVTPLVIVVQYLLGGLVRHLGTALFAHAGMALAVLACVAATVFAVHHTRFSWLRRPADLLGLIVVGQVLLGAGAWITKFGFPPLDYVAVDRSPLQIAVRTSHTLFGMLLLMTSVLLLLRVARIAAVQNAGRRVERPAAASTLSAPGRPAGTLNGSLS